MASELQEIPTSVSYKKQTIDNPNPLARFAHRSRHRLSLQLLSELAPNGTTVVDFGAGTGEMLHLLGQQRPDLQLLAVEPYLTIDHAEIVHQPSLDGIEPGSVDVLTAFEVMEHLSPDSIEKFIADARRVCRKGARIVVSVPIMQGLALPLKELNRMVLFRRKSDHSPSELVAGLFGGTVFRTTDIQGSHKGFDHRVLDRRLRQAFTIERTFSGPLTALPWWANSQAFFIGVV